MRRVSVIGNSGVGKSTFARKLADVLRVRVLELDGVFHQPGWTQLPTDEFQAKVTEFVSADGWVVDGSYIGQGVAEIVWDAADTLVWLDPPMRTNMRQLVARTFRRLVRGEVLWNGNRERWFNMLDPRPEENVLLWAWTRHSKVRTQYEGLLASGTWDHLDVHRLRSHGEVGAFIALAQDTKESPAL